MQRVLIAGIGTLVLVSCRGLAQSTATYIGPNNGVWSIAGNWNVGQVPVNAGGATFNAIVPTNLTVEFDLDGSSTLSGLNLQSGSLLNLNAGRQLTVSGVSVTAGMVSASGAGTSFRANSPFASMQANSRAAASAGAVVRLGGISYYCAGYYGDILSATGAGSLLDMSTFGAISAPYSNCCNYRDQWVRASDGGVIDLSSLATVEGASYNGNLRFREETGGRILLPNLVNSFGYVVYEPTSAFFQLPSLQNATSANFVLMPGNTIDLPAAAKLGSCYLSIGAGGSFLAPNLATCTSSVFTISDGGTFYAPGLNVFDYSSVELNPQRTFTVPAFTSIHGSSIRLLGGKQFAVAATEYATASAIGDMLTATGVGTLLDASSLISIRTPYSNCCNYAENRIRASSGGIVDISGVKTLEGVAYNGWLWVRSENGGVVRLSSLKTTTNWVLFDAFGSNLSLPLLESASYAQFNVGVFDTISMGSLEEVHNCGLSISDGGTVLAPSLTNFDNSYIELTPSRFFEAPEFKGINNSRIFVKEGKQLSVAATEYVNGGGPGDTFGADGFNSELDLSSVLSFSAPYSNCCNYGEVRVRASNYGVIDLSGLTTVAGAAYNGLTRFDAVSGGTLRFGSPVFATGSSRLSADGIFSNLFFHSVSLRDAAQMHLTLVANAHFTGSFDFTATDENAVSLGDGKVYMVGDATGDNPQRLEVGCPDLGTPTGALAPNFQIGQLTIGRASQPTVVQLVDEIDNGNRPAGQHERLYLQGFPSEDGLRILGGSTLYLGDIELYAVIGNQWKRVRNMFGPGQTCIPFDGGQICLGEPLPCPCDLNGDGLVDDADFQHFVVAYNILDCADPLMPPGCRADFNGDAIVEDSDFQIFVVAYNELLCP